MIVLPSPLISFTFSLSFFIPFQAFQGWPNPPITHDPYSTPLFFAQALIRKLIAAGLIDQVARRANAGECLKNKARHYDVQGSLAFTFINLAWLLEKYDPRKDEA